MSGRIDAVRLDGVRHDGVHLVIAAQGHLTAEAFVVTMVARAADGTLRSGELDDARAVDVELSVELYEVERVASVTAPAPTVPVTPKKPTWADVAQVSAAQPEAEANEPEAPMPKLGDVIEHPTFGTCSVAKVEEDEEFVMVRTGANRILRLSLDVLRLERVSTDENGRHTFRARGGKRG